MPTYHLKIIDTTHSCAWLAIEIFDGFICPTKLKINILLSHVQISNMLNKNQFISNWINWWLISWHQILLIETSIVSFLLFSLHHHGGGRVSFCCNASILRDKMLKSVHNSFLCFIKEEIPVIQSLLRGKNKKDRNWMSNSGSTSLNGD